MKTLLLPTAYQPPIVYFALLATGNSVLIENHETFLKQSWRNRCTLLTSQGVITLSIPLKRSNHSKTFEIVVDDTKNWRSHHWKTIESAYNKSPFFDYYRDELHRILFEASPSLVPLNQELMQFYLKSFKLTADWRYTDDYYAAYPDAVDYRELLHPKRPPLLPLEAFPSYYQVFGDAFVPNLSVLDLLCNEGPDGRAYLLDIGERVLAGA